MPKTEQAFPEFIGFKAPRGLRTAIAAAAKHEATSGSTFIRQAVLRAVAEKLHEVENEARSQAERKSA
jgi:hypothetical protein